MPNRPAIPTAIAREVMIESGQRCAVCGLPCSLEKAHIVPWSEVKEHTVENLVCLCATCHRRSHDEGWDADILREYKQRPWVVRQFENYSPARSTVPPFQAPRVLPDFVGRENEIERLVNLVQPGTRAAITGVIGMGGVGKTELAKVVADKVGGRFADGVLWADCGKQNLVAIADLWAGNWGVQLAGGDEVGKAAAWRALVSRREALLVFDDVQAGQVVEPLLPAAGRSAVLITTRDAGHLDLAGAERLELDLFDLAEAQALVDAVLGAGEGERQAGETEILYKLTGGLPLGMSVALHLARECAWDLATLNRRLRAEGALPVLGDREKQRKSLNATFEAAWAGLDEELQATFATLALFNDGPSFDTAAAAAVLNVHETEAGARLARLAGRSLLTRVGEGRWTLHTLLRAFTAGKGLPDEGARARMARHYVPVVQALADFLQPGSDRRREAWELLELEGAHHQAVHEWAKVRWQECEEAARLCSAKGNNLDDVRNAYAALAEARRILGSLEPSPTMNRDIFVENTLGPPEWRAGRRGEGNRLGAEGSGYAYLCEAREAIEYYGQALAISREIRAGCAEGSTEWAASRVGEGTHLGNLAIAYAELGEARRAIEYLEQALAISREICAASTDGSAQWTTSRRLEGVRLSQLGNVYAHLGEARQAIEYYEQALAISREIGPRRWEAADLGSLGHAYYDLKDARQAIEYYEQALAISRETGDRHWQEMDLENLGHAYSVLREERRAIEYYEQALAISREICAASTEGSPEWREGRRNEKNHLTHLAQPHPGLPWRSAEYQMQELVIECELRGDREGEGHVLTDLGVIYARQGKAQQAIESYEQALAISREIGDRHGERLNLGNLGNAYASQGKAQQAIESYEQALAISREIGDRHRERLNLGNLGSAYADLGEARRAIDYHEQALAISREIGDRRGEGNHLGNLGNAYANLGEARRAIDYYEQALAISREIGDRRNEGIWSWNLGLLLDESDPARAAELMAVCVAYEQEIGHPDAEGHAQRVAEIRIRARAGKGQ
jgi:tetratricopeptide (TPR) repeat protein